MSYAQERYLRDIYNRQQVALLKFNVRRVGDVAEEPITLGEAQRHLDLDTFDSPPASDWDDWITAHIPAAREYCEQYLGRALAPRTMEYVAAAFPVASVSSPPGAVIALPFGPVQSVTSITYLDQAAADAAYTAAYDAEFANSADAVAADAAGDAAAAAALTVVMDADDYTLNSFEGQIELAYGVSAWPAARAANGSVKIRYVTGYSLPDDSPQFEALPKLAHAAMLVMLRHLFDHPGDEGVEIPKQVMALLDLVGGRERLDFA